MQRHLALLSLVVIGCSDDAPSPNEVRTRIATDLVAVTDEANAATADGASIPDISAFSLVETALGGSFGSVLDTGEGSIALLAKPRITRLANLIAPRRDSRTSTSSLAPEDPVEEDAFDGAEAAQWLNENLFTDANHAGGGIYKVPASLACTETVYDDSGNEIGEEVDAECAQSFNKLELRIRAGIDDDVLRLALQVGPNHDEPLEIGLAKKLLSVTVDLDEAEAATRALASKFGGDLPNFALDGRVTAKLEVPNAAHARVALDVDRAISVRVADPGVDINGPDAFAFTTAKATVFSLALDGNARSMEAALGLGATTLHAPDEVEGTTDLTLGGLTGTATFAENQPLRVNGISLGTTTTTLKIDGATALAIDLNPNDGRALDLTVTGDTLSVTPRLDLRTQVDHAVLGDAAPVYDVTRVFLDGGLRVRGAQLEVTGGTFAIDTNPASYGFSAAVGQCVSGSEMFDTTSGEYYTTFAVGACL